MLEYNSKIYLFAPIINANTELIRANKFLQVEINSLHQRLGEKMLQDLYGRDRFYEFGVQLFNNEENFFYILYEINLPEVSVSNLDFPIGSELWPEKYLQQTNEKIENLNFRILILNTFSNGNIQIPEYNLVIKRSIDQKFKSVATLGGQSIGKIGPKFEIENWNNIYSLTEQKLKSIPDYIKLALKHLEKSFNRDDYFSFLSILIGFEVIFNNGKDQIRYTISRNVAVMIGNSIEVSKEIFKKMKSAYDIRSSLVHNGKYNETELEDYLPLLESYLKKSLRLLLINKFSKDELIEKLTLLGFGNPLT
ncbi:hypothetical protein [Leptospira levettii]|uniref:hypothetical protein n=1 Tax=Leptospira levettii TaxID=2023178 RepID=UPI003EBC271F